MSTHLTTRLRNAAGTIVPVVAGLGLALLVVACGPGSAPGTSSAAAASARAEASSSAGQAAKAQAISIADDCKPAGGFDTLEPGVPGAAAARKTFEGCEKIPESKVFGLGVCLARAYSHAPAKGAQGSAAETARQGYLADAEGACVQTAKGHPAAGSSPSASTGLFTPSSSASAK